MQNFEWTDERVATLTRLVATGLPFSQIASRMRIDGEGPSRNAALGKASRLGLRQPNSNLLKIFSGRQTGQESAAHIRAMKPGKPRPVKRAPKFAVDTAEYNAALAAMDAEIADIGIARKGVIDLLPSDCRWPIGDPGTAEFHFCAREKVIGSYCEFHARKAFAAPSRQTERPSLMDRRKLA